MYKAIETNTMPKQKFNYKILIINYLKFFNCNYNGYVFLFLIIFTVQSCNNEIFDENNVLNCADIKFNNNKAYINDGLMNASCFIYDANNNIVELRTYKNGVKNGIQRGYYFGVNKIEYEGFIKNGEIHGPFKRYHSNGALIQEGKFIKGYYSGKWNYYDEDGKLTMTKLYTKKNGKLIDSIRYN